MDNDQRTNESAIGKAVDPYEEMMKRSHVHLDQMEKEMASEMPEDVKVVPISDDGRKAALEAELEELKELKPLELVEMDDGVKEIQDGGGGLYALTYHGKIWWRPVAANDWKPIKLPPLEEKKNDSK